MAKKATLTTITSTNNKVNTLNENFEAVNNKFDNTLSLDGSTPNALSADVDLNSQDVNNVKTLRTDSLVLNGQLTTSTASIPNFRNDWVTATSYIVTDLVRQNNNVYICLEAHTSGVFATDLAASRWALFAEGLDQSAVDITGGTIDGVTITNATAAQFQAASGLLADIAGLSLTAGDVLYYNGTDIVNLGVGTAGEVLTVNAGGTAPEWAAAASGGTLQYARIRRGTNQTITSSGFQPVTMDTLLVDVGGWTDIGGTFPNRLTVPSGVTKVKVGCLMRANNASTTTQSLMSIYKNGSELITVDMGRSQVNAEITRGQINSSILDVVATDYFELYNFGDSNREVNGGSASEFYIEAVG